MNRGAFITLEGIDGTGKSTQAAALAEALRRAGQEVVLTREPGGSPGAEEIRTLLVQGAPGRWSAQTELLLFAAARRDHVERTIRPALDRGAVVVCDRFVDSTRVYQGMRGLRAEVDLVHHRLIGLDPDLTLVLDMDPDMAAARTDRRASRDDRFEQQGVAFQRDLRAAFHALIAETPDRYCLIDAARPAETIAADIERRVRETFAWPI